MSRTSAAETEAREGRTIGDILLARGFVTREKLDEALDRQRSSGKPLGQILVEEGAISRLELASALAEQWSDIGSVSPEFGLGGEPSGGAAPLVELQELRNSRRVLEERLRAFEQFPASPDDRDERARLASRLAGVEAAVAGLQEHDAALEVTRLGQTVTHLSTRMGELAATIETLAEAAADDKVGDIDRRLAALGAAVESAFREMDRRADENASALAELGAVVQETPAVDLAPVVGRLAELELQLGGLAPLERVDALVESVAALQRAAAALPDHSDDVVELGRRIDVIAGDSAVASELVVRADALEARLEELAEVEARVGELATLGGGLTALEARVGELAERRAVDDRLTPVVEELAARVDALSSRPVADGETDGRVAELGVRFENLAALVEGIGERPVSDPQLAQRVEELAVEVAALGARAEPDPALVARLDALAETVSELAARPHDGEGGRMALAAIADLAARVDLVAERPERDPATEQALAELGARVEAFEGRIDSEPKAGPLLERLEARLDTVEGRVPAALGGVELAAGLGDRIDRLEQLVSAQADRVADVAEQASAAERTARDDAAAASGAATERLAALEQEAAALADEMRRSSEEVAARIGKLDTRVEALAAEPRRALPVSVSDALATGGTPRAGSEDQEVERLRMMVERLMHDFADHRRAVSSALSSREFTALLEELAARVDELQAGGVIAAPVPVDGQPMPTERPDVRGLTRRLDDVEESVRASRDGVFQRLERMMGTIDWRLQRLEHPEQPAEAD